MNLITVGKINTCMDALLLFVFDVCLFIVFASFFLNRCDGCSE